jgi:hypothetical protein
MRAVVIGVARVEGPTLLFSNEQATARGAVVSGIAHENRCGCRAGAGRVERR